MARCASWGCISDRLNWTGFGFTASLFSWILSLGGSVWCTEPRLLSQHCCCSQRGRSWAHNTICKTELIFLGTNTINKRSALEHKAGLLAWPNCGPYCWDLVVVVAQGVPSMWRTNCVHSYRLLSFCHPSHPALLHAWIHSVWRCLADISEILVVRSMVLLLSIMTCWLCAGAAQTAVDVCPLYPSLSFEIQLYC